MERRAMPDDVAYSWELPAPSRAQRSIPRASTHHFVGELVSGKGAGQRQQFESLLEYRVSICALYYPGVVDVEEQVGPVTVQMPNGRLKRHFLDLRVHFIDGLRWGIAVKPQERAEKYEFQEEMALVRAAAVPGLVDRVSIVTEANICRIRLANAELMHASRFPDPEVDERLADFCSRLEVPMMVSESPTEPALAGER